MLKVSKSLNFQCNLPKIHGAVQKRRQSSSKKRLKRIISPRSRISFYRSFIIFDRPFIQVLSFTNSPSAMNDITKTSLKPLTQSQNYSKFSEIAISLRLCFVTASISLSPLDLQPFFQRNYSPTKKKCLKTEKFYFPSKEKVNHGNALFFQWNNAEREKKKCQLKWKFLSLSFFFWLVPLKDGWKNVNSVFMAPPNPLTPLFYAAIYDSFNYLSMKFLFRLSWRFGIGRGCTGAKTWPRVRLSVPEKRFRWKQLHLLPWI